MFSEACENCKFFDPNDSDYESKYEGALKSVGECRRKSPTPKPGDRGMFPNVFKHDWCGEWLWTGLR